MTPAARPLKMDAITGGAAMRWALLFSAAFLSFTGCSGSSSPAPAGPTQAEIDARVKEEVAKALEVERKRIENEKKAIDEKMKAEMAKMKPMKKELGFEDAWTQALKVNDDLDSREEKETEEAVGLLGGLDAMGAKMMIPMVRAAQVNWRGYEKLMVKYGLDALHRRKKRETAFASDDFKKTCKAVWAKDQNPADMIAGAEAWGSSPGPWLIDLVECVQKGERPRFTQGVKIVASLPGGEKWLKSVK